MPSVFSSFFKILHSSSPQTPASSFSNPPITAQYPNAAHHPHPQTIFLRLFTACHGKLFIIVKIIHKFQKPCHILSNAGKFMFHLFVNLSSFVFFLLRNYLLCKLNCTFFLSRGCENKFLVFAIW
jgi:hypothetical protein